MGVNKAYGADKRIVSAERIETDKGERFFCVKSSFAADEVGGKWRNVVLYFCHNNKNY